jgi:voltage-gated potassium channel
MEEQEQKAVEETVEEEVLEAERYRALHEIESFLELPIMVLGFIWLVLVVIDLVSGLNPLLTSFVTAIWVIFVLDFILRLIVAPRRIVFIRNNALTLVSLAVPALRFLQITRFVYLFRLASTARSLRMVSLITSFNRGMRSLRGTMGRRGFGYVALLTLIVVMLGAAGMYAFERRVSEQVDFQTYGEALWWTGMMLTTMGTGTWPVSTEGRFLALLLSIYAFSVFGYVTATLATFFIGQEEEAEEENLAGKEEVNALRAEIISLRTKIDVLVSRMEDEQS